MNIFQVLLHALFLEFHQNWLKFKVGYLENKVSDPIEKLHFRYQYTQENMLQPLITNNFGQIFWGRATLKGPGLSASPSETGDVTS